MQLIDAQQITLTNTPQEIAAVAGPSAIQVVIDLRELTSGDTVVVRTDLEFAIAGGGSVSSTYTLTFGSTTSDFTDGVLGTDWTTWVSPVIPVGVFVAVNIESTAGALVDVEVQVLGLGVAAP